MVDDLINPEKMPTVTCFSTKIKSKLCAVPFSQEKPCGIGPYTEGTGGQ